MIYIFKPLFSLFFRISKQLECIFVFIFTLRPLQQILTFTIVSVLKTERVTFQKCHPSCDKTKKHSKIPVQTAYLSIITIRGPIRYLNFVNFIFSSTLKCNFGISYIETKTPQIISLQVSSAPGTLNFLH